VFSPIAFQEFAAQKYREFVQTLSDDAPIEEGKQLRWLSGDGKIVQTTPSVFFSSSNLQGRISAQASEMIPGGHSQGEVRGVIASTGAAEVPHARG
jgi:protein involved in ribonucleotide reduction